MLPITIHHIYYTLHLYDCLKTFQNSILVMCHWVWLQCIFNYDLIWRTRTLSFGEMISHYLFKNPYNPFDHQIWGNICDSIVWNIIINYSSKADAFYYIFAPVMMTNQNQCLRLNFIARFIKIIPLK